MLSKSGGNLDLRYPNVAQAVIKTADGQRVKFAAEGSDQVRIETIKGQTYVVTEIPDHVSVTAPADLKIEEGDEADKIQLSWTGSNNAASYRLYRAVGNAPNYELNRFRYHEHQFCLQSSRLEKC